MPKGIYPRPPIEERFWKFVKKERAKGCWVWTGCIVRRYGGFQVNGQIVKAHRFSWEVHYGPIPDGLFVCHKCDNPLCIRPDHLFLGTHQDNMNDMKQKGRTNTPFGERSGMAKLTEEQVLDLRNLRATTGISYAKLGRRFGICTMQAHDIVKRKNWKHV